MTNKNLINNNKIVMRRMFKQDIDLIFKCYTEYKKLYSNPVTPVFINNILLDGEIWGAFSKEKILACCVYFPLKSNFYKKSFGYEVLKDFVCKSELYFCMGYVGYNNINLNDITKNSIYQSFLNICQMQAFRNGFKYAIHITPIKLTMDISPIFKEKFILIKLRGLENLVVHYIFVKSIYNNKNIYDFDVNNKETISCNNTKILSKFLDNNYCATQIIQCETDSVFSLHPLITD